MREKQGIRRGNEPSCPGKSNSSARVRKKTGHERRKKAVMPWKKYILELKQEFDERGYLYIIDEPVGGDIYRHPRTILAINAELFTQRLLRVKMFCELLNPS